MQGWGHFDQTIEKIADYEPKTRKWTYFDPHQEKKVTHD